MNKTIRKQLIIISLYLLITLFMTFPLPMRMATHAPILARDSLLETWYVTWDIHALITDPLHLYDANFYWPGEKTLTYDDPLLGWAFITAPLTLSTLEPLLSHNLVFLFILVFNAFGMYLLVKYYTRHEIAAFLAGLIFTFNPYRMGTFEHRYLLGTLWMPYAILFLDLFLRRRKTRYVALFTLFFLWQTLFGVQLAQFLSLICAVYVLGYWWKIPTTRSWRVFMSLVLSMVIVIIALLPVAAVYLTTGMEMLADAHGMEDYLMFSARPTDYLAAHADVHLMGRLTAPFRTRPDFNAEVHLFLGILAPLMAIVALIKRRARLPVILNLIIFAVAFLLTFGPTIHLGDWRIPSPYRILLHIPVYKLQRDPARWVHAAIFALSVLAGYGFAVILPLAGKNKTAEIHRTRRFSAHSLRLGGCLLFTIILLAESCMTPIRTEYVGRLRDQPEVYHWLAAQPGNFAIIEFPLFCWPRYPEYPEARRMYASTIHWKNIVNGYCGFTPPHYAEIDARTHDFPSAESLDAIAELGQRGLRYVLVHSRQWQFDTEEWEQRGKWAAARSTVLNLVGIFEGVYVYEVNPWGDEIVTAPDGVTGEWRGRLPQPVNANFADKIMLRGYEVKDNGIVLYWQAMNDIDRDYTVFVHLLDEQGNVTAQADSPPVEGHYPTSRWRAGEVTKDEHRIDTSKGARFSVGLYLLETMERLDIVDGDNQIVLEK